MKILIYIFLTSIFLLFSCQDVEIDIDKKGTLIEEAVAVLYPVNGSNVSGNIHFFEKDGFIEVIASVDGLELGNHGFHIHKYGDLTDKDAVSTGYIYKSEVITTVDENLEKQKLGRLGNIYAIDNSTAKYNQEIFSLSIDGKNPILGRAIVIHKNEDDLTGAKCGNAGEIVAAGIIGIANSN